VDKYTTLNIVKQMVNIGLYFEKAIAYQEEANKKVAVAVKVTDEVAEQLASGAESTSEAANELDRIVNQLRQIVGN
jgi:methyl-accepting chemotaxis protein